jgi:hypothetical protein
VAKTSRRRWDRALLVVLVVFLGLEVVSRTILVDASKDFRRFKTYAERARTMHERAELRIALIGNSATDRGVDPKRLAAVLRSSAGGLAYVEKFVADASRINTWQYMLKRYFWAPGNHPDLFVVTFYENDLQDGNPVEIGRLAQFFTTFEDWPAVFDLDLPHREQQVEFVLSSVWTTYAVRARFKERLLDFVIPGYKKWMPQVNAVNMAHTRHQAKAREQMVQYEGGTHRALDRLLADAKAHNARILFVAYPIPTPAGDAPYAVDSETIRRIRRAGMDFLDMRGVAPLALAHYEDDVHLTTEGAQIYTDALAGRLAPLVVAGR